MRAKNDSSHNVNYRSYNVNYRSQNTGLPVLMGRRFSVFPGKKLNERYKESSFYGQAKSCSS